MSACLRARRVKSVVASIVSLRHLRWGQGLTMTLMMLPGQGCDHRSQRARRAQPEGPHDAANARQPAETTG